MFYIILCVFETSFAMSVQTHVHVIIHACRNHKWMVKAFFNQFYPLIWRLGLLLSLEIASLARISDLIPSPKVSSSLHTSSAEIIGNWSCAWSAFAHGFQGQNSDHLAWVANTLANNLTRPCNVRLTYENPIETQKLHTSEKNNKMIH